MTDWTHEKIIKYIMNELSRLKSMSAVINTPQGVALTHFLDSVYKYADFVHEMRNCVKE